MGRKSKLTSDLQEEIVGLIADGVPDQDVCQAVGIAVSTFYNWLAWGEAFQDGAKRGETVGKIRLPKSGKTAYMGFLEAVTRARGTANVTAIQALRSGMAPQESVTSIRKTITETRLKKDGSEYTYEKTETEERVLEQPGDWRAAVEYLKRRDPENWSEHHVVAGAIELSPDVVAMLEGLGVSMEEVRRAFEDMVRQRAAGDDGS
jgi:hypothetical protein